MKKILLLCLIVLSAFVFAQSDYETTQNFKNKAKVITDAIKTITTQSELDRAKAAIEKLKSDYISHKDLLDKALYPDDFDKVISRLNKSIISKNTEITKVSSLENQITDLRIKITDLNDKNLVLLGDIKELTRLRVKDSVTINELNAKVRVLGKQIRERDELVVGLVDSLLQDFINKPETMTDVTKRNLERKIDSRNLFTNIKRTLNDNIDFLELTIFTPEDLIELKEQNKKFREVWKKLGPQLTEFYINKNEKKDELNTINSLFNSWNSKIDNAVWESINYHFKNYNVNLLPYNNGSEFTANILAHITLELNGVETKTEDELYKNYHSFNDSVWVKEIRPNWLPMLLDHNYLTKNQRITIEEKIVSWELAIDDNDELYTIYIVFGILFLVFAVGVIRRYKK